MAYRTIQNNTGEWGCLRIEKVAAAAIEPGMLVEITSANKFQAHSTEGTRAQKLVALEDVLQGNGVDTDYSMDDRVSVDAAAPGSVYNMILKLGEAVSRGDELISAGDGKLIARANATTGVTVQETVAWLEDATFTALAADALKAVRIA